MLGCLLVALLLRLMLSRFCVTFTLLTDVAESFAGLGVLQEYIRGRARSRLHPEGGPILGSALVLAPPSRSVPGVRTT